MLNHSYGYTQTIFIVCKIHFYSLYPISISLVDLFIYIGQKLIDVWIDVFPKNILGPQAVHMTYLNMDRKFCVIKTVAYSARTDTQTDTWTE